MITDGVSRHRQAVGSFRAIRLVRPHGNPTEQVRGLIEADMLSTRHVLMHFDDEAHGASALFEALDQFVLDKKNANHASRMPLGVIKVTRSTLQVIRNYITGVTGPVVPIVCAKPTGGDISAEVRALVHDEDAGNKFILLFATITEREESAYLEEYIARLTAEVHRVRESYRARPLGLLVYNHDVLSCWESYVHSCTHSA